MKIDFLVNSLVSGGGEHVLVLLANYFKKKGHDVSIITFNEPEIWKPDESINRIRLHHGSIKNHMLRSLKNLTQYYYHKKNRPDVLISFMTQTSLIGIIVARLFGVKVIASEHTNHLRTSTNKIIVNFTRKYIYRLAHMVTILTSFDTNYYARNRVKTIVMPNPCSFSKITNHSHEKEKVILAVGGLDKYHIKGFDNLLSMIGPVFDKNPGWKLKLIGGGEEGTKFLKDLAAKNNISNKVIFEGFSTKVSEIMRDSEIYIMTSRWEGLPLVLIEAMSQGMACISYDLITGPSEIIDHNENGILVENQNSEMMCKELDNLIKNPEKRIKFAKQAIDSLDRFEIENIYKKYLNMLETL